MRLLPRILCHVDFICTGPVELPGVMHESVVRLPETPQNVTYVTVASLKFRFPDTLIMRKDPRIQRNVHCFQNVHLNFQNILS